MNSPNPLDTTHFNRLLQSLAIWRVSQLAGLRISPAADRLNLHYPERVVDLERHLFLLNLLPVTAQIGPATLDLLIYDRVEELFTLLCEPHIKTFLTARPNLSCRFWRSPGGSWPQTLNVNTPSEKAIRLTFMSWGYLTDCPDHLLPFTNYWCALQLLDRNSLDSFTYQATKIKFRLHQQHQFNPIESRLFSHAALLFIR